MTATDALTPAAITRADLDFDAVLRTYEAISRVLPETPSWSYPLLNAEAGVDVVVKHENIQPTGAFKVRGGVALMAALSPEERRRGVVTASTGNHAQSLAWAGAHSDVPVTVVVPISAPARKVAAVRALGARVVVEGDTMCDALAHAEALSLNEGMRMVSPGDEPAIVLGHATVYLELFRRHPGLRTVYAPVGSGSGADPPLEPSPDSEPPPNQPLQPDESSVGSAAGSSAGASSESAEPSLPESCCDSAGAVEGGASLLVLAVSSQPASPAPRTRARTTGAVVLSSPRRLAVGEDTDATEERENTG